MFISNKLDSIAFGNIEGQLFHKQLKLEEKIKIVEQFYDPAGKSQDAGEDQHWRVAHDSTGGVQENLKTQKKINIEEQLMNDPAGGVQDTWKINIEEYPYCPAGGFRLHERTKENSQDPAQHSVGFSQFWLSDTFIHKF